MHEPVKDLAMPCPVLRPGYLALLCCLIALGGTAAAAAGVGVNLRVHAHNIPQAIAGGRNLHVGAGTPAPSRQHLNTRSIKIDGTGESTAGTRLAK